MLSRITTREEGFKGKDSVSLPFFSLRIFMKCVFMINYERVGLGCKIKISLDIAILLALLKRVCKCVLIFFNHTIQILCLKTIIDMNKTQNFQIAIF